MLARSLNEYKAMRPESEMSVVPYHPPAYPTAPMGSNNEKDFSSISLGVLNNAMSDTTAATQAEREEKVAYASFAEALRDSACVREIKKRVSSRTIIALEKEYSHQKKIYDFIRLILFIMSVIAVVTSSLSAAIVVIPETKILKEDWISILIHVGNLFATGVYVGMNKYAEKLDSFLKRTRKEIVKKRSYIEAANVTWDSDVDTLNFLKAAA
uniref:NS3 n=1 Tax=Palyam virus TaxID=40059 RepID=A0A4V1HF04_9REOV|nr:NS3 [Palyam virus]